MKELIQSMSNICGRTRDFTPPPIKSMAWVVPTSALNAGSWKNTASASLSALSEFTERITALRKSFGISGECAAKHLTVSYVTVPVSIVKIVQNLKRGKPPRDNFAIVGFNSNSTSRAASIPILYEAP